MQNLKELLSQTDLSPAAKIVLLAIKQHIEEKDANLTYGAIAERTAMTTMGVLKITKDLVNRGFIQSWKDDQNRRYYK